MVLLNNDFIALVQYTHLCNQGRGCGWLAERKKKGGGGRAGLVNSPLYLYIICLKKKKVLHIHTISENSYFLTVKINL